MSSSFPLILASSSRTRQQLLQRLGLNFQAIAPDINESPQGEQHADQLAQRLAYQKALHIAQQFPDAIVIGSDQVAWRLHEPQHFLGKPLTVENAVKQLQQSSGQSVMFSTALSVIHLASGFEHTVLEHFQVKFCDLSLDEIQRYIQADDPLHCAGSFKCEQLGISLFESMQGNDFTSLMGLPLIQLCHILRKFDFQLP